ncbi:uncharacterized protein LOC134537551 isoform X1 [Bacillus rossius redtenbacheri]|uniref:uncharacterized protein LOC134537551 isoform X1 n=1 Tax=Bacillus rossius redtenbacheri TaxID=93214 RepID=UPI002FDEAA6F
MEDADSAEVPRIEQVCSIFKAAIKLLEGDTDEIEEDFVTDNAEYLGQSAGSLLMQESVAQDSCNFIQKFVWPHEGVLLLLEEYRRVEYEFNSRRKRHGTIWEEMAAAIRGRSDLNVTGLQCQQKISSLKRTYANIKENFSSYEADEWPYFAAVEELFGNKDRAIPTVVPHYTGIEGPYSDEDGSNNPDTGASDGDKKLFFVWPHEGVLSLLQRYKEVEYEFYVGRKRHNKIWDEIAEAIHTDHRHIRVTGIQCQQKISGMKRTYWGIKETHPCPSPETVPWPYYFAADEIFNRKTPIVIPAAVRSPGPAPFRKQKETSSSSPLGIEVNSDTNEPNKKNVFSWPYDGVFILLEQYRQMEHQFYTTKKRHNKIWDEIAEAVQAADCNLRPTGLQCQQKISGLKRTYMTIKENHPCPNAETVTWPYYTAIDEIFGHNAQDSDDGISLRPYTSATSRRSAFAWPHEGVRLLLQKFKEAQPEFFSGEKRHCKIWKSIAAAIQASSALKPTGMQCQQKINSLKRTYVAVKENRSGTDVSWPYFPILDEIFGGKTSMPVLATIACSAGPELHNKRHNHSSSSDDGNNAETGAEDMYERPVFYWSPEGVLELLKQYKEVEQEFLAGNKLHTKLWDHVAAAVRARTSLTTVTGVQCLQKLCRLKRIYKTVQENNPCASVATVSWPYFAVMEEMFGAKSESAVPALASSSGPELPHNLINVNYSDTDVINSLANCASIEKKKNSFSWPYKATLLLLKQYNKVKHEFVLGRKRHNQIWDEVAVAIRAASTYKVTGVQCQTKFCGLKRTYMTIKENRTNFSAECVPWPFFSAMDDIFGSKVQSGETDYSLKSGYSLLRKRKNFSSSPSSNDDEDDDVGSNPRESLTKKIKVRLQHTAKEDTPENMELLRREQERNRQKREERKHEMEKMKMKQIRAMHEEKINLQRAALDILKEILSKQ